MANHGTPSAEELAPFVSTGTRALILFAPRLSTEDRGRWANSSEQMQEVFARAFLPQPLPLTPEQTASGIVKTVTIQIGGGRTMDEMIAAAKKDCGDRNVSSDINQRNMPTGFGPLRSIVLEFRQFDHDPYTEEVTAWQNEPGHGPSGYQDGMRFREYDPEAQRKQPHIFIPEDLWCDADGVPCALDLWGNADARGVNLNDCSPRDRWVRNVLFARRKYSVG